MIQEYVDRFMAAESQVREKLAAAHPEDYKAIVRLVIETVSSVDAYSDPDPERIHEIDDGDYQGTLLFVIGAKGYQPDDYWFVKVGYGSCSGCDTLESIRSYDDNPPNAEQANDYWTLALHIVQGIKAMDAEVVVE